MLSQSGKILTVIVRQRKIKSTNLKIMTITKTEIPKDSLLNNNKNTYDYVDSFQGAFIDKFQRIGPTEIAKLFFSSSPKWIDRLLTLRNIIVKPFGLKGSENVPERQKMIDSFNFEKGEQIGLFKVFDITGKEIIVGEDDKHLNYRVSLLIDSNNQDSTDKKIIISTTVKFNNLFGRLYFLPVRPFHKLIVPTILKGIIKNIEKQN